MMFRLQPFAVLTLCVSGNRICSPDFYFDVAVDRCESCMVICRYAEIQGTKDDCDRLCPDYRDEYPIKATEMENGLKVTTGRRQETRDKNILLIPVFIGVGICVCMVVITAAILRCRDRHTMRQQRVTETLRVDLLRHIQDGPRFKHQTWGTTSSLL